MRNMTRGLCLGRGVQAVVLLLASFAGLDPVAARSLAQAQPPSTVPQGSLTEAQIETAIKCGQKEVKCDVPVLWPGGLNASLFDFEIRAVGPAGRVYLAALEAKSKYLKFARQEVTAEMLAPVVTVRAWNSSAEMKTNVNVTHIVVLPRRAKTGAVQPVQVNAWSYDAKNLTGTVFTREGREASFKISDLPPGELDFVIVNDTYGDVKAGISAKDRARLDLWPGTAKR